MGTGRILILSPIVLQALEKIERRTAEVLYRRSGLSGCTGSKRTMRSIAGGTAEAQTGGRNVQETLEKEMQSRIKAQREGEKYASRMPI